MSKLGSRDPGKFQHTARFSAASSFAVQRQRFHVKFATHLPVRLGSQQHQQHGQIKSERAQGGSEG
jgi:hypothetical protein